MGRSGDHRSLHLQVDTEAQRLSWSGHSQCKLSVYWAALAWSYFLQNPRSWRAELQLLLLARAMGQGLRHH